jgi:alpha-1,3-rhamnosyl/mannosyltransferase
MNLCLDARAATSHFPGISRYIKNLAQAMLTELRPDDTLNLLLGYDRSFNWIQNRPQHASWTGSSVSATPFSVQQQWHIPSTLQRIGASIYHSPYYLMPYRPGIPTVLTVYDLIPLQFPQHVSARVRLVFRLSMILALKAANQVIAISDSTRRDFIRYFPQSQEKIQVIPLAAEGKFHPPSKEEIRRVRKRFSLPDKYVLYLGINKPHKNLVNLVKAWVQIVDDFPTNSEKLVIAGAWDDRYPEAKLLASDLNLKQDILFLGSIAEEDLPGIYGGARLFVFPSLYEGFGLPVLEALACGTPVACSRVSSLPEVAGDAAVYFDPNDPDNIAEVLIYSLENKDFIDELKFRGKEQTAKYSWQRTAQLTGQVYRQVSRSSAVS